MSGTLVQRETERRPPKSNAKPFMVSLTVAAIVIIVISLLTASGLILPSRSATIVVTVHSSELSYAVDYTLRDNGEVVETGRLGAGSSETTTMALEWKGPLCESHIIEASSGYYGGYYGLPEGQDTVNACDGETYTVHLYV